METSEDKAAKYGKSLLIDFYILVKTTVIYDSMNETILTIATRLLSDIEPLLDETGEFAVKLIEGAFYIEGIRIKAGVSEIESFMSLADELGKKSIGMIEFRAPVSADDLIKLAYSLQSGEHASGIQSIIESSLIRGIAIGGPVSLQKEEGVDLKDSRAMARRAYLKTLAAVREMDASVKAGVRLKLKKIKRALHLMIDSILADESYLLRLTGVGNYENYHFYHQVNVAILSAVIGKRLGLNRVQMRTLALAAFFHDVGKVTIPVSILNKKTGLTAKEYDLMHRHPMEGVTVLLKSFGLSEILIISMLAALEHHMKLDFSGYPAISGKRKPAMFSRIIGIADDYDSLVSGRVYGRNKLPPEEALKLMLSGSGTLYDPILIKAFAGIFSQPEPNI